MKIMLAVCLLMVILSAPAVCAEKPAFDSLYVLDSILVKGASSVPDPASLLDLPRDGNITAAAIDASFSRFKEAYDKAAVLNCGYVLEKRKAPGKNAVTIIITVSEKEWVKSVSFTGNLLMPAESLANAVPIVIGNSWEPGMPGKAISAIRGFYRSKGLLADAALSVTGGREKSLLFNLTEQPDKKTVLFRGNRAFSGLELMRLFRPAPTGDTAAQIRGTAAVLRAYHQKGFFDCAISQSLSYDTCVIVVAEGRQARFTGLHFSGNAKINSDTLLMQTGFRAGEPFSQERLNTIIEAVLQCYDERGFPFCEVRVQEISRDSSGVAAALLVSENLKYYFGKVRYSGNLKTRPEVMERLVRIRESLLFSQSALDRARDRLEKCGLFESVDPLSITLARDRRAADVVVNVKEGAVSSAEGVLGYQPNGGKGNGLSGYVNLDLKNLAGTMRALRLHYLKEKPLTTADFGYLEPWIMGSRLEGEVSFNFAIDELSYTRLEVQARVAFPVNDNLKAYTGLSRLTSTYKVYGNGDSSLVTEEVTGSHAGMELDLRDFPENPKQGFYIDAPLSIGIKSGGEKNYNEFRPALDAEGYFNPHGAHVIACLLHYASLFTADTALSRAELVPLGGTTTLRGYRENQFYGRTAISLRNEYRYLFGKRGRGVLFLDAGAYDAESPWFKNSVRFDALLLGYGAGLFMRTAAGYVGVNYGLGRNDRFSDGKLHLVLKNTF